MISNTEPFPEHYKAGTIGLTAVLVARPQDAMKPISLLQSWLPINHHVLGPAGPATFRCPGVIPCLLGQRGYLSPAPLIEAFARAQKPDGWVVQPVSFLYQPQIFRDQNLIEPNGRLNAVKLDGRNKPLAERIHLDVTYASENQPHCLEALDLCLDIIRPVRDQVRRVIPDKLLDRDAARLALMALLLEYPFLAHHLFEAYPMLHMLTHNARIHQDRTARELRVKHVRYHTGDGIDLNTRNYLRQHIPNVIA